MDRAENFLTEITYFYISDQAFSTESLNRKIADIQTKFHFFIQFNCQS